MASNSTRRARARRKGDPVVTEIVRHGIEAVAQRLQRRTGLHQSAAAAGNDALLDRGLRR